MSQTPSQTKETELEKKLAQIEADRIEEESVSLAERLGLPFSDMKSAPVDNDALVLLDEVSARKSQLAVILKTGSKLTVVAVNPEDPDTASTMKSLQDKGFQLNVIITSPASMAKILSRYQDAKPHDTFEIGAMEVSQEALDAYEKETKDLSDLKGKVNQVSATEMLEVMIAGALRLAASDIHFEPEVQQTRVRYRLDGVLQDVLALNQDSYSRVLSRIKVLSKLKLNVHSMAQDGRFTIKGKTVDIEVRVSVLPSEFGETVVMRLLDPRNIKNKLEDLGMREDLLKIVKSQIEKSTGAILTTGPTGSGKTTSLYAFVQYLNSSGTKIVTIEDPIEYHVEGISQTQVDAKKGYTFANGLRAIVRQDPDIILVGEIRDQETADIALQAALTGHLVLSTIHTNNAAGTIPRLIDLGLQPQIIAPAINMAMAQRLVRKLCPSCKIKDKVKPEELEDIKSNLDPIRARFDLPEIKDPLEVYFPGKCKECNETGYRGRIGVYEAFIISNEMERLILKTPAISEVEELAVKEGMVTMLQDAYMKLLEGVTSLEEIKRILG